MTNPKRPSDTPVSLLDQTPNDFNLTYYSDISQPSFIAETTNCENCDSQLPKTQLWHVIGPWSEDSLYEAAKIGRSHVVECPACNNRNASILCPVIFCFEEIRLNIICIPETYPQWEQKRIKESLKKLLKEHATSNIAFSKYDEVTVTHPNETQRIVNRPKELQHLYERGNERARLRTSINFHARAKTFLADFETHYTEFTRIADIKINSDFGFSTGPLEGSAAFIELLEQEIKERVDLMDSLRDLLEKLIIELKSDSAKRQVNWANEITALDYRESPGIEILKQYDNITKNLSAHLLDLPDLLFDALSENAVEIYYELSTAVIKQLDQRIEPSFLMAVSVIRALAIYRFSGNELALKTESARSGQIVTEAKKINKTPFTRCLIFALCRAEIALSEQAQKERKYKNYIEHSLRIAFYADMLGMQSTLQTSVSNAVSIAVSFAMKDALAYIATQWPDHVPAKYLEKLPEQVLFEEINFPEEEVQFLDAFIRIIPLRSEPYYPLDRQDDFRMEVGSIMAHKLPLTKEQRESECLGPGLFDIEYVGAFTEENLEKIFYDIINKLKVRSAFIEVFDFDEKEKTFSRRFVCLAYKSGFSPPKDVIKSLKNGDSYLGKQEDKHYLWLWAAQAGHGFWVLGEYLRFLKRQSSLEKSDQVRESFHLSRSLLSVYGKDEFLKRPNSTDQLRYFADELASTLSKDNLRFISNEHPLVRSDAVRELAMAYETLGEYAKAADFFKSNIVTALANRSLSSDLLSREQIQSQAAADVRRWARVQILDQTWDGFAANSEEYLSYLELTRAPATTEIVYTHTHQFVEAGCATPSAITDFNAFAEKYDLSRLDLSIIQSRNEFNGFWICYYKEKNNFSLRALDWNAPYETLSNLIDKQFRPSEQTSTHFSLTELREQIREWIQPLLLAVSSKFVAITAEAYMEAIPWNHFAIGGEHTAPPLYIKAISSGTLQEAFLRPPTYKKLQVNGILNPNSDLANAERVISESLNRDVLNETLVYTQIAAGKNRLKNAIECSDVFIYLGHGNLAGHGSPSLSLSLGRTIEPEQLRGTVEPNFQYVRVAILLTCWGARNDEDIRFQTWEPNGWPQFLRTIGYSHIITSQIPITPSAASLFCIKFFNHYSHNRSPLDSFREAFNSTRDQIGQDRFFEEANGLQIIC